MVLIVNTFVTLKLIFFKVVSVVVTHLYIYIIQYPQLKVKGKV
nr:MAG TPA: hypothetical protein [Caudoviricetes sp.]